MPSSQHLFDAFTPTWSAPANDNPVEVATNFVAGADGQISTLDWYRAATTAGIKPDRLRLYDGSTGQVLAELTALTDSGAVGWQRTTLTTPATVYAGRTYKVAANWAGTSHHTSWGVAINGQGNFPLTVGNPERSYHYAGTVVSGATSDNGAVFGVDVTYLPGSVPPPGSVTVTDVQGALADWFDPTDATKPSGSAKLYPNFITSALASLSTLQANLASGFLNVVDGTGSAIAALRNLQATLATHQAKTDARMPNSGTLATSADVTAARDAINTQTGAYVGQLSAHVDGLDAARQTQIADHDTNDAARFLAARAAIIAEIDAHSVDPDALAATINANTDADKDLTITAVQAAQAAIGAGINAHDAGVKDAIDTATTAVNDHTDGAQAELDARIDAHDAGVKGSIAAAQDLTITAVQAAQAAIGAGINAHDAGVKSAVAAARDAVNAHTDTTVATARDAVNAHTDTQATAINANTDANVNGLGVLLSAQHTTSAAANAAEHVAITALLTGETGVLAAITAITSAIAAVAGVVADALTILNALRGGSGTAHQTASADFAASPFLFAQPADYYDVEVTTWSNRQGATSLPAGTWLPYVAWVAPLYGSVYGPKVTVNFSQQRIVCQHGATGLLIYTKAGAQGHVRAFQAS